MATNETQGILEALEVSFGDEPWLLGDALKKAKPKQAFSKALRKPPAQIKATDLKNLVNDLWAAGHVEIIPPKDRERSFKYRLVEVKAATPTSDEAPKKTAAKKEVVLEKTPEEALILEAYQALRLETQFRHVYIADICEQSGVAIDKIHAWASLKARNREFELGQADWSLANERQREAAIKINGIHYLTVGQLT